MCLSLAIEHPERVLAKGEHVGFEWMVIHNGVGSRCGYVRIPPGHPWYGQSYHDIDAHPHGGLTFGENDIPCDLGGADDGYWIGFDCGHTWDLPDFSLPMSPEGEHLARTVSEMAHPDSEMRTQEYVEQECRDLCEEARVAANGTT